MQHVVMSNGAITPTEQVRVGCRLLGADSTTRHVVTVRRDVQTVYRIQPNKGERWLCGERQLLALWRTENPYKGFEAVAAGDFAQLRPRVQRSYALYRRGVSAFDGEATVLEPWFMGYWLGDGAADLKGLRVASADPEVAAECEAVAVRNGLKVTSHVLKHGATTCKFYDLSNRQLGARNNALKSHFRALGLHNNKHIPATYLTAPLAGRRELLAGIIDSDGHVHQFENSRGTAEIGAKQRGFAEQIAFLGRSLGLAAYVKEKIRTSSAPGYGKSGDRHHVICLSGDLTQLPMRIARKRAPTRQQIKNVLHTGLTVERVGTKEYIELEVDGDGLFLLGDFTVASSMSRARGKEVA